MRYIRTYEEYSHEDGLEVDMQSYPEHNQAINQRAKKCVEDIFDRGAGESVAALCKEVGIEMPKVNDERGLEEAQKRATEYLIKNPGRIGQFETPQMSVVPVRSGDGVARTNNLGGVHQDRKYTA
jgi:hypothetical protein